MKTLSFASLLLFALFAGLVAAADSAMPPLLCDSDMIKAAAKPAPACPPVPPPACAPAKPVVCPPPPPLCPPAPPLCPPVAKEVCRVVEVPVRQVVNEVRTVPVKKRVYEEECYVAEETRIEITEETRTRTAQRRVPVLVPKEYSDVALVKVQGAGHAPRLSRSVSNRLKPVTVMKTEEYEQTYNVKVRNSVTVPVVKTRRVAREVEELTTVTVPVTVTVMESRVVSR